MSVERLFRRLRESRSDRDAVRKLYRHAKRDPFQDLSPEFSEAMRSFLVDMSFWLGNSNAYHLKRACKEILRNKELRAWLHQHVNLPSYTLYYGKKQVSPQPEVGQNWVRKERCQQWSTRMGTARWFGGLPHLPGGILVQAQASGSQVLLDVDQLSALGGMFQSGLREIMAPGDPSRSVVELFSGEAYEGEVITSPLTGRVIEVS